MKSKWVIISLGLLLVFTVGYLFISKYFSPAMVVVNNESSATVSVVTITYSGEELVFKDIKPNGKVKKNISPTQDAAFDVEIVFEDGTVLTYENLGYITNGDRSLATFTIKSTTSVDFKQSY